MLLLQSKFKLKLINRKKTRIEFVQISGQHPNIATRISVSDLQYNAVSSRTNTRALAFICQFFNLLIVTNNILSLLLLLLNVFDCNML